MRSHSPSDGVLAPATGQAAPPARRRPVAGLSADTLALLLVLCVAVVMWVPRRSGPIDLRWDGGVYYILGTSLAQGKGYKLLNEPGQIDAVQYPPLLPAVVAAHQLALGTSDPRTVGRWFRLTSFVIFVLYAVVVFRFLRPLLPLRYAVVATLLSLFCLHAWFLSDALFPEVWFSVATLLFLMFAGGTGRVASVAAYLCAVASYALRTVGLAALTVWVLESLVRRRFRQALLRAVLVLIPVAGWQFHVASVERSDAYRNPAYAYQRAPYLFYNVSYARNVALRDPFTPEKGTVNLARRVVRNALDIPVHFGETLSASHRYFEMWLHGLFGDGPIRRPLIDWSVFGVLFGGGVLVLVGVGLQLLQKRSLVPLYVLIYTAALCLTPFPGQYLRYIMPIVPLLALSAMVALQTAGGALEQSSSPRRARTGSHLPVVVSVTALLIQVGVTISVYVTEHQRIAHSDRKGERVEYRLFFYNESQRGFDEAVEYVRRHAAPGDVVAAGTPHWIYLWTGLTSVMPPFERDVSTMQALLDSVPVTYLLIGRDVVATERYTAPVVQRFADEWAQVYATRAGGWEVYRRRHSRAAGTPAQRRY